MASNQDHHAPTSSELFSSAKMVAGAAQSAFNNESDKVDKAKVAGAAADLLDAAKDYGKLEQDKGIGQYVNKAETYLHQYESSGQSKLPTTTAPEEHKAEEPKAGESGGSGGGVGDYMKMAQGFLSK